MSKCEDHGVEMISRARMNDLDRSLSARMPERTKFLHCDTCGLVIAVTPDGGVYQAPPDLNNWHRMEVVK
jgi:hypothetical protein